MQLMKSTHKFSFGGGWPPVGWWVAPLGVQYDLGTRIKGSLSGITDRNFLNKS